MSDWIPFMTLAAAIPVVAYAGMAWGARPHKRSIEVGEDDSPYDNHLSQTRSDYGASIIDGPCDLFARLHQATNGVVLETQALDRATGRMERQLSVFTSENIGEVGSSVHAALVARRLAGAK